MNPGRSVHNQGTCMPVCTGPALVSWALRIGQGTILLVVWKFPTLFPYPSPSLLSFSFSLNHCLCLYNDLSGNLAPKWELDPLVFRIDAFSALFCTPCLYDCLTDPPQTCLTTCLTDQKMFRVQIEVYWAPYPF